MYVAEFQLPDFATFDLTSLRTGMMSGAPCPVELMKRVLEEMHIGELVIAYGQTETSPVVTMSDADDTIEVARPVILRSPLLTDEDMLHLIVECDVGHQETVAARLSWRMRRSWPSRRDVTTPAAPTHARISPIATTRTG